MPMSTGLTGVRGRAEPLTWVQRLLEGRTGSEVRRSIRAGEDARLEEGMACELRECPG